jgi:hypothetical protein
MEEVLVFIIQFFVEIVFQVVLELIVHLFPNTDTSGKPGFIGWMFIYLLAGATLGGAVTAFRPQLFIQNPSLRIIHFFFSPVAVAASAYFVNRLLALKNDAIKPKRHAAYGFVLALGYVIIRMGYGLR